MGANIFVLKVQTGQDRLLMLVLVYNLLFVARGNWFVFQVEKNFSAMQKTEV
jgi:hypothetical protein